LNEDASVSLWIGGVAEESRPTFDKDWVVLSEDGSILDASDGVEVDGPVSRTVDLDRDEPFDGREEGGRDEVVGSDDSVFLELDLDGKVNRLSRIDILSNEAPGFHCEGPKVTVGLRVGSVVGLELVESREERANESGDGSVRRSEGVPSSSQEKDT